MKASSLSGLVASLKYCERRELYYERVDVDVVTAGGGDNIAWWLITWQWDWLPDGEMVNNMLRDNLLAVVSLFICQLCRIIVPQHCVNNNYKLSYQFPPILSAAARFLAWECSGLNNSQDGAL